MSSRSSPEWQMPPRSYRRGVRAETKARVEDVERMFDHRRSAMQQHMVGTGLAGTTAQESAYFEIEREREQSIREAEFAGMSAYYGLAQPYHKPGGASSADRWTGAATGAVSGAMMGASVGGWWGAGIGGVVGAGLGYFAAG